MDQAPAPIRPQEIPSVGRLQLSDCVVVTAPQMPPPHVGVETLRERVPVVSQVSAKPSQLPQAPKEAAPQPTPFVGRLQLSFCVVITTLHMPPAQDGVATVRERVPVVSQASSKAPQLPHSPKEGDPQPAPSVSRAHARSSLVTLAEQLPALQA